MTPFEILDVPIYAKAESIENAYAKKVNDLKENKDLFSEAIYQKKIEELNISKQSCLETISKNPIERLKIHAKDAYKKHTSPNVLHDGSLCGSCCSVCCNCYCEDCGCETESEQCDTGFVVCASILFIGAFSCALYSLWADKKPEREKHKKVKAQERTRHNQELLRQKEISKKTEEIKKRNKHIGSDIERYKKLCKQTSCTVEKIKPCSRIVVLLDVMNDDNVDKIKEALSPYQKCAEEKADIQKKVEKIAQLYRDIGNPTAATVLTDYLYM